MSRFSKFVGKNIVETKKGPKISGSKTTPFSRTFLLYSLPLRFPPTFALLFSPNFFQVPLIFLPYSCLGGSSQRWSARVDTHSFNRILVDAFHNKIVMQRGLFSGNRSKLPQHKISIFSTTQHLFWRRQIGNHF
jgi:hypothetical protein